MDPSQRTKSAIKSVLDCCIILMIVLVILEICFRLYLIDFYSPELNALNADILTDDKEKPVILAMGDSHTADPLSYVQVLRQSLPQYKIINSAIPGTTVTHALLMARSRIKKWNPTLVIYQIYIGNDFFEMNHKTPTSVIPIWRRAYWWISDRFLFLGYMNFRLRFFQGIFNSQIENDRPKEFYEFNKTTYSAREKMLILAYPDAIEKIVNSEKEYEHLISQYLFKLSNLAHEFASNRILVLILPHPMQMGSTEIDQFTSMGAKVINKKLLLSDDFALLKRIKKTLNQENMIVLNALPLLKKAALRENIFYANDPHINSYGHQVLAKEISRIILEQDKK